MAKARLLLTDLAPNQQGTVMDLQGGPGLVARLATLGFTPGALLTMVQNYGHGPLIVRVRDTRIALGRGEARKIVVLHGGSHGTL
jgi:ferrous iron transport protein A